MPNPVRLSSPHPRTFSTITAVGYAIGEASARQLGEETLQASQHDRLARARPTRHVTGDSLAVVKCVRVGLGYFHRPGAHGLNH